MLPFKESMVFFTMVLSLMFHVPFVGGGVPEIPLILNASFGYVLRALVSPVLGMGVPDATLKMIRSMNNVTISIYRISSPTLLLTMKTKKNGNKHTFVF